MLTDFVLSFVKIAGTVSKLKSGYDFVIDRQTERQMPGGNNVCKPPSTLSGGSIK